VKTLEVRRHSLTKTGVARVRGSLLSAEGVRRARLLGGELPDFDYVLTGPDRRHVETAIAMGYAVDEVVEWPSGYVSGVVEHHDQWQWEQPFVRYAELLESSSALRAVAEDHLGHWRGAIDHVADGCAALVISSGGSIEPVLVAAFAGAELAAWGSALHQLDGATLTFDGLTCIDITINRSSRPSIRARPDRRSGIGSQNPMPTVDGQDTIA
jgi:broad specificity phosphatase PhoE